VTSLADYIADNVGLDVPSLSASIAHVLLTKSPAHAWHRHPRLNPAWAPETNEAAEIGTIAHALLLERDSSRIVEVLADDWRTKAAKEAREAARSAGMLPVLSHKLAAARTMVEVAYAAWATSELPDMATGEVEQTLVWGEPIQPGVSAMCRCRPDWLSDDRRIVVDYKTTATSAEPNTWSRGPLLSSGYDLQAAFVTRAVQALYAPRDITVVFLVQEVEAPFACSFVSLAPSFTAWADEKFTRSLALWSECLSANTWPAYPQRIAYAEPPEYAIYAWQARHGIPMPEPPQDDSVEAL
jgi:hypothetical protein